MTELSKLSKDELQRHIAELRAAKEAILEDLREAVKEAEVRDELDKLQAMSPAKLEALKRVQVVQPLGIKSEEKVNGV